jgi:KilA-N domain
MNELTIGEIAIHRNDNHLYSLNDLHAAAGGEERHKPSNFMRLDTTQALIAELNSPYMTGLTGRCSDLSIINFDVVRGKGKDQGTFVCKELVYSYAMWISPAFHIQVIRAYDEWIFSKSTPSVRHKYGIGDIGRMQAIGVKQNSSPSLSKQIELSRSLEKMGRMLKQTVIATDPWAKAQYIAMLKNYCEVTGTECIDPALIGARVINDPPEIVHFWDTFEAINGGVQNLFNHSSCPDQEIALKLSQIYGHCQTQGISFPEHNILRPLLLKSERYRYAGNTPVWSRLWRKTIRCMIFTKN